MPAPFARLFEHPNLGQILVTIHHDALLFAIEQYCVQLSFPSAQTARIAFNEITEIQAQDLAEKMYLTNTSADPTSYS